MENNYQSYVSNNRMLKLFLLKTDVKKMSTMKVFEFFIPYISQTAVDSVVRRP